MIIDPGILQKLISSYESVFVSPWFFECAIKSLAKMRECHPLQFASAES